MQQILEKFVNDFQIKPIFVVVIPNQMLGRRKKRSSNAVTLKQQIFKEAREQFLSKGFAETSTVEIAKNVGCNQALVYYYYKSKDELFLAVFRDYMLKAVDSFYEPALKYDSLEDKIAGIVRRCFEFLGSDKRYAHFFVEEFLVKKKARQYVRGLGNEISFQRAFIVCHKAIHKGIVEGKVVAETDAATLITDILTLCVSTFLSLDLFTEMADAEKIERYLNYREKHITELILNNIMLK